MKILKPTVGGHDGSSFRELLDLWDENGYCEVVPNTDIKTSNANETMLIEARPWINEVGDILLYDNPILDKLHEGLTWNKALFCNEVLKEESCFSWTFWPNHPRTYAKVRSKGILYYDERECHSCFLGSYTTHHRQNQDWQDSVEAFWMGRMNVKLFNQEEYLEFLRNSKFGLCLRGVGPKCLRDIELIGMGTVPIFTPGVSDDYYNKLEEGKHYLYASCPEEVKTVIEDCSKEKWQYLSDECIKWYEENSSITGSFELTKRIVEEN